jgi:hypothetical protein
MISKLRSMLVGPSQRGSMETVRFESRCILITATLWGTWSINHLGDPNYNFAAAVWPFADLHRILFELWKTVKNGVWLQAWNILAIWSNSLNIGGVLAYVSFTVSKTSVTILYSSAAYIGVSWSGASILPLSHYICWHPEAFCMGICQFHCFKGWYDQFVHISCLHGCLLKWCFDYFAIFAGIQKCLHGNVYA